MEIFLVEHLAPGAAAPIAHRLADTPPAAKAEREALKLEQEKLRMERERFAQEQEEAQCALEAERARLAEASKIKTAI